MKKEANQPTLSDPEIVTYDKTELTVDSAYVVLGGSGGGGSSRRYKLDFAQVNVRRALRLITGSR